jgi:hypothetical protein
MGYWDTPNINDDPGAYGLTLLAALEYSDQSYCFDTRLVWADADGKLFTYRDSGCSCPIPFEGVKGVEDLESVDLATLKNEVDNELDDVSASSKADGRDFLRKVQKAILNPQSVQFDQAAYDIRKAEAATKRNIGEGLREAARFVGLSPYDVRVDALVQHAWDMRDLSVAQVHTLGTYLANIAGQMRDAATIGG